MKLIKKEINSVRDIGEALKQYRKNQNITQIQLSQIANVGNRIIIELEKGKPTIQMSKALHILNKVGIKVNLEYFLIDKKINK